MRDLNKQSSAILRQLCDGLNSAGDNRKIDNNKAFMAVCVECIQVIPQTGARVISVAHYFEQCGDLCCDPDMTFLVGQRGCFAMTFQQAIPPIYQVAAEVEPEIMIDDRLQEHLTSFANQWMRNIKEQQDL